MSMFLKINDSLEMEIKIESMESPEKDSIWENFEENLYCTAKEIIDDSPIYLSESPEQEKHNPIFESKASLGRFLCNLCNLAFPSNMKLVGHFNTKHPKYKYISRTMTLNKMRASRFKCHICKNRFPNLSYLQKHVNENHDIDRLCKACNYCDSLFDDQNDLSNHTLSEHGIVHEKIYICTLCGYRTTKSNHYRQHNNMHFKEKTHECPYCDYIGNHLSNYKTHLRTHYGNRFFCKYVGCEFGCKSKLALINHQLKHDSRDEMNADV